ncbi:MAG: peptidase domain-containing ABC transporter, partial [Pseudomonadota bacterium]
LKQLIDIAATLGLSSRPLRADLTALHALQCPCILHWDLNHFVVLKSGNARTAVVYDPAQGAAKLTVEQVSQHFTGVALELTPVQSFRSERPAQRMRLSDLWSGITGLKRSLALTLVLSLVLQLLALAAPFYLQTVIDDVALRGDQSLLTILALGFGLLLIIEVTTTALRASVLLSLATRLHLQLAANLKTRLLQLPLQWFQSRHLGDVLSRFSSIDAVRDVLSKGLVAAVVDGLMAILMLVVMLFYSIPLTLIVLCALLLYVAVRVLLFQPLRRASMDSIAGHAQADSTLMESARGIQTIKLLQGESDRREQWLNRTVHAMNSDIRAAKLDICYNAANGIVFGVENIVVVFLAAILVMENSLSIGMLIAFMSYKQRFISAMNGLVDQCLELRMLGLHLERISDIALAAPEPTVGMAGRSNSGCSAKAPEIVARGLGFRHSDESPWLFRDLSFQIEPGSCIAIVGASGAGKTTLLHCLMGLYQLTEGEILINQQRFSASPEFRGSLSAVTQDDRLLSGSILDNIVGYGQSLEWERIIECAQKACIHEEIEQLPMRYETLVGDMGAALSGGQVQRVMLARALYRRPSALFLDEATSHLDPATEDRINVHLRQLPITRIMVAHRAETVALADRLIALD